ncbi:MAG: bifunctional folylpolyglutamate synthase/dihydrofolate synthase [Candidatus Omnitrophica bacterium]|nr:bifunctional folylpolyglutamate synthase/dihydrofolate synthase [Candidatus Omnitrophota bacterium]
MFTYDQAINYLEQCVNFERMLHKASASDFSLDNIQKVLQVLGNPQDTFKSIHIAGTKGKGSTAAIIASILRAAGFKVGLYTSPHILDIRERIFIDDRIGKDDFARIISKIKDNIEQALLDQLTYFEWLTVIAFMYFAEQKVDWAVLETGLGGRLDATNVVDSFASVITPIGLEHTKILGETIAAIASEKAAIIKSMNKFTVIAKQYPEAEEIINKRIAAEQVKNIFRVGKDAIVKECKIYSSGQNIDIALRDKEFDDLKLSLFGECQAENLVAALCVVEGLRHEGFKISDEAVYQGAYNVHWSARFEIVGGRQTFVLDCCHTQESVNEFVKTWAQVFPNKKPVIILGLASDKNRQAICECLQKIAREVVAVTGFHDRAYAFTKEELKECFKTIPVSCFKNADDALNYVQVRKDVELVVVVGSVYLIGKLYESIKSNR